MVGADVLSNAARFTARYTSPSDVIQERSLAMVDVPHDCNDGCSRFGDNVVFFSLNRQKRLRIVELRRLGDMAHLLNHFAGEVTSVVKAHVIYSKPLDVDLLKKNLQLFITTADILSNMHGLDFINVTLTNNIEKLAKRYPDKYSDEDAILRADKMVITPGPSIILPH